MNTNLINFYTKDGQDSSGRTLEQILNFSHQELEEVHDFIQWLFPTKTPSRFAPDAPLLDDETISILKRDEQFRRNFYEAVLVILKFWGFPYIFNRSQISIHVPTEKKHWMKLNDHNLLRISRFLESCRLLGFSDIAEQLFTQLTVLAGKEGGSFIHSENIYYWWNATYPKT